MASTRLSAGHPGSETLVVTHASRVIDAATLLISAIHKAVDGRDPLIEEAAPLLSLLLNSQHGGYDLKITPRPPRLSPTISFEFKKTTAAFAHGGSDGLQKVIYLDPMCEARGADAIAIKVSRPHTVDGQRNILSVSF